jgi:hypothetical protein
MVFDLKIKDIRNKCHFSCMTIIDIQEIHPIKMFDLHFETFE